VVSVVLAADTEIVSVEPPAVVPTSPAPRFVFSDTIVDRTAPVPSQRSMRMLGATLLVVADSLVHTKQVIAPAIATPQSGGVYHDTAVPSVPAVALSVICSAFAGAAEVFLFNNVELDPGAKAAFHFVPEPAVTAASAAAVVR
jgi:hypothetical protein